MLEACQPYSPAQHLTLAEIYTSTQRPAEACRLRSFYQMMQPGKKKIHTQIIHCENEKTTLR